jgi:chemotaxis protein CheZ
MDKKLKHEISSLVQHVDNLRQEIAIVAQGRHVDSSSFQNMSSQLDAIVDSTEQASNIIMEASEKILDVSGQLSSKLSDAELKNLQDKISAGAIETMEACSFQDIVGQRTTKVLGSLKFVEERVESMLRVCGLDQMMKLISLLPEQDETEHEIEMSGPALAGEGLSQDEIDAMLGF